MGILKWLISGRPDNPNVKAEAVAEVDSIISCAKLIIDNGKLTENNAGDRCIAHAEISDGSNRLYIAWYGGTDRVRDVRINGLDVPSGYDSKIFRMAHRRIEELIEEHVKRIIRSVKH